MQAMAARIDEIWLRTFAFYVFSDCTNLFLISTLKSTAKLTQ